MEGTARERLTKRLVSLYAELPDDEKALLVVTLLDAGGSEVEGYGSPDKLGNFEIQSLMSNFNEAQTLVSSVLKKKDDAANAVIQKI